MKELKEKHPIHTLCKAIKILEQMSHSSSQKAIMFTTPNHTLLLYCYELLFPINTSPFIMISLLHYDSKPV